MVDSRRKGATAELKARDELRKATGLQWQRTPGSGALHADHMLKGDLYVPNAKNKFCIEVKHYKDDNLTSKILTSKSPIFLEWWAQAVRQGEQVKMNPLLIFKFDRSKWFVAFKKQDINFETNEETTPRIFEITIRNGETDKITICLLSDFTAANNKASDWVRLHEGNLFFLTLRSILS